MGPTPGRGRGRRGALLLGVLAVACSESAGPPAGDGAVVDRAASDRGAPAIDRKAIDHRPPADARPADATPGDAKAKITFVAVTFNTGTTADTSAQAPISAQYYGNGLAWTQAVNTTKAWFAQVDADVVVFQEIFYSGDCPSIPASARTGYVCETWKTGDPLSVAQTVLGAGWQVGCNPGKTDKCAAVNTRFGKFQGCSTDYCASAITGYTVTGCGKGARVGRAVIDLASGGTMTLVNVHGSSGIGSSDQDCRVEQFEQVFVDIGDGAPAANGTRNLVLGDLNTDPVRLALFDKSAAKWSSFVGPGKTFRFITDVGFTALPTYAGLLNIDHVVGDVYTGTCWHAGATSGHPAVIATPYFDHKPAVCTIKIPQP